MKSSSSKYRALLGSPRDPPDDVGYLHGARRAALVWCGCVRHCYVALSLSSQAATHSRNTQDATDQPQAWSGSSRTRMERTAAQEQAEAEQAICLQGNAAEVPASFHRMPRWCAMVGGVRPVCRCYQ
jgi:hypothetical protein